MKVNTVAEKQCDVRVLRIFTEDVHDPVIFRKNGGDDLQFFMVRSGCAVLSAAGAKAACRQKRGDEKGKHSFYHNESLLI